MEAQIRSLEYKLELLTSSGLMAASAAAAAAAPAAAADRAESHKWRQVSLLPNILPGL
jgi:hypothetical protein